MVSNTTPALMDNSFYTYHIKDVLHPEESLDIFSRAIKAVIDSPESSTLIPEDYMDPSNTL